MCNTPNTDGHEEPERPFRMKRRVRGQRVCGVCGDLALCHNFGAVTCETCKAFFRRNANRQTTLQACAQGGSCIITKVTRRHCASCRLQKCYAIGMDPGLILNDEELKERQQKQKKTVERQPSKLAPLDACFSPSVSTSFLPDLKANDCPTAFDYHTHHKDEEEAPHNSQSMADSQIPSTSSSGQKSACRLDFQHINRDNFPSHDYLYCKLTRHEISLLDYLNTSYKDIFWSVTHPRGDQSISIKDLPVERVMVAVDSILRKFINFSKRVPEFQQLAEEDKVTLLKSRSMNVYCVRLAEAYDCERRLWKTTVGEVAHGEVAHLFSEPEVLNQIVSFSNSAKYVVQDDITAYGLMFVLVLFNPIDSNLQNRDFINNQKDKYIVLLKHYLESRFSFLHADRYLAEIINILVDIDKLAHRLEEFFNQYSTHFFPLITEFLGK